MRTIAAMTILLLALSLPASGAENGQPAQDAGRDGAAELRPLLDSFGALAEEHFEKVLEGLRILAATGEAQSGEWDNLKGPLSRFAASGMTAAAVWFLRPDGSYYVSGTGPTGQSLRDRPYFPRLMAGSDISGDLAISKATGKRTAVVAVPIKKNGQIIGALGASIDLEALSRTLDQQMKLPESMFFYALDPKGQTALHRKSALLFGFPSDMGSRSLARSVNRMLSEPEGVVTYDFYGERTVAFKRFPVTGWVFALGTVTGKPGQPVADLPPILMDLGMAVTTELLRLDQDVAMVARRLSEKELPPAEQKKLLGGLCRSHPYAVDCSLVDRSGRMALVAPEAYAAYERSDISAQEQVVRLRQTKKPVLSQAFKAVEGFEAVDLQHPVLSPAGELQGSVSILFKPQDLLAHILAPILQPMAVEAFVMQKDGRILYDEDPQEVGRMLFQDPLYKPFPQLLALGSLISREPVGAGSYEFRRKGSQKLVTKDAHWMTVGLHRTEWRLVVMHVRPGEPPSPGR
ncbi:MAG: cache domain-containing protein [Desulfobacteraceae bacterium]|nr:cache domain-containing protein [Desulfobacteraceae bacterium]